MNDKSKIKTFQGVDIFVNERGRFSAQVGKKLVEKSTLSAVEKEIAEQGQPVKVIVFSGWSDSAPSVESVVKYHANGNPIGEDKRQITARAYVFDQQVWDEMQAIGKEIERMKNERRMLTRRLREFTKEAFDALRGGGA